jgi:transcriptional regulator with XRE-family HTH domain
MKTLSTTNDTISFYGMRSLRRTTTAVVRSELGMSLQEFADLIGKSPSTVESLEGGRLRLSETTALVISKKTGVSIQWLLAGDPSAPMTNSNDEGWTIRAFEKGASEATYLLLNNEEPFDALFARIRNLLKGQAYDPDKFVIVVNRIDQFLDRLSKEFPPQPQLSKQKSKASARK